MAINGKNSKSRNIREDIQDATGQGGEASLGTATLRTLSPNTLAKLKDSVIENMGAFRFLLDREETLKGFIDTHEELLKDCRVIVAAHGHKALVKKIDRAIEESRKIEPVVQA